MDFLLFPLAHTFSRVEVFRLFGLTDYNIQPRGCRGCREAVIYLNISIRVFRRWNLSFLFLPENICFFFFFLNFLPAGYKKYRFWEYFPWPSLSLSHDFTSDLHELASSWHEAAADLDSPFSTGRSVCGEFFGNSGIKGPVFAVSGPFSAGLWKGASQNLHRVLETAVVLPGSLTCFRALRPPPAGPSFSCRPAAWRSWIFRFSGCTRSWCRRCPRSSAR